MPGSGGGKASTKERVELSWTMRKATCAPGSRLEEVGIPKGVESQLMPPEAHGTAQHVGLPLAQSVLSMSPSIPFRIGTLSLSVP